MKTATARIFVTLLAATFLLSGSIAHSINAKNLGFESGDLTGWSPWLANSAPEVVTGHDGVPAPLGDYMVLVKGSQCTGDFGVTREITLKKNQLIKGRAAFISHGPVYNDPYRDDVAAVQIFGPGGAFLSQPWIKWVTDVGPGGSSEFEDWSYRAPIDQVVLLLLYNGQRNSECTPSHALFDLNGGGAGDD